MVEERMMPLERLIAIVLVGLMPRPPWARGSAVRIARKQAVRSEELRSLGTDVDVALDPSV
jgi:hypothetical protein